MVKPCKYCGKSTHHSFQCGLKQLPLKSYTTLRAHRPMKRMGKVAKKWTAVRRQWIRQNPGPWSCYLCGKWLTRSQLTLDHIKSRSRHPELRYELSNLAPCCWECNIAKGSKDIKEI